MLPARLPLTSAWAAACAGAAVWFSLGTMTAAEAGPRAVRVGLLPPVWWLAALVAAAVAVAWALRLPADRARPLFFSAVVIVPWLPIRLPPALLLWTGPLTWLVWAAIFAAVIASGSAPVGWLARWRALLANPARAPWMAFACAAILYCSAAWRLAALVPGGDEPHYLVIAQSLWRDGDLRIENNHRRGDYLEYFGGALRPDYLRRGIDGQIYSIHLPGVPALIAPVLALGGYGLVKACLALVSAGATAVAWRTAFLLSGSAAAAWFGWAAVALTTPFLLLSFTVYPDGPGAVVAMFAFAAIAGLRLRPSKPAWWWAAAGLLPALLPWFHPRFAVIAGTLGLVFAGRAIGGERPWRALAAFALFPAASAAGWFGYYSSIYGRFNPAAAYGHYTQMSVGRIPIGLLGLLFDQQYGLLAYAPVFAAGVAGLAAFFRRSPRLALEWVVIVVPYVLVTAMYHMWWGGFSSPARFIGATLLLFAVPAAIVWAASRRAITRGLLAIGLGVSLAITSMLLAVERGEFVFNVRDTVAPWLVWAGQIADLAHGVPSAFRRGPLIVLAEAAIWAAAIAAAWLAARAAAGAARLQHGAGNLVLLCGLGAAMAGSNAAVWRLEGSVGTVVTAGQLRALDAAGTPRASIGLTLEPFSVGPPSRALERLRLGLESAGGPSTDAWLRLPSLPAGRYRLWVDVAGAGPFDTALVAGRADGPIETWQFEGSTSGASSREFDLPVGIQAVAVRGNAEARRAVRAIWIQPLPDDVAAPVSTARASAARRLGRTAVFALGNAVYLEPGGFWTAAGKTAEVVLRAEPGSDRAEFTLCSGPVATPVEITSGAFVMQRVLEPGERRDLTIPLPPGGAALVMIRAEKGFRPSSVDPASTDMRMLGVRLEPR